MKGLVYSAMVNVTDGGCWSLTCDYRIYSNKHRGAYLIFRATSAALIRGRRLFEGGAYSRAALIRLLIVPDKFTFSIVYVGKSAYVKKHF